tara:strand:- start:3056 stop:3481 length:426 start_codon:yes stop_codon:yes gene_type:complete
MGIESILLFQIVINVYLLGVIIMTQFITYPTFLIIDKNSFNKYHRKYVNIISIIVAPAMVLEITSLIVLVYLSKDFLLVKSLILLLCIWLTTFIIMVPSHNILSRKNDSKEIKKLININWVRTFLWSVKLIVMLIIYYEKI